jgi:endoglucanase Acf2
MFQGLVYIKYMQTAKRRAEIKKAFPYTVKTHLSGVRMTFSTTQPQRLGFSFFAGMLFLASVSTVPALGQSVPVGAGSYNTVLPNGAVGPRMANGQSVTPKVSATFSKPVQTNDFWSSLIYPFYNDPFSNALYAHPLVVKAVAGGLQMGYTLSPIFAASDYLYPFQRQLTVGITGMTATKAVTDDYGDWTATALWEGGGKTLKATFGHGMPFVFFTVTGGNVVITTQSNPTIWSNSNGVLGITIEGRHYGIFAPAGSQWTGSTTLGSDLGGKNYLSVAVLPDNQPATLEFYRKRAYAFVTNTEVSWNYDEAKAVVTTSFTYTTDLKESGNGNVDETISALYRHQWMNTPDALTSWTYVSARGQMKVHAGKSFTTRVVFGGVLPSLPDEGAYNKTDLLNYVRNVSGTALPVNGSYENGKAMGRFARLVNIADQLRAVPERDALLTELKRKLEGWLTAGGTEQYVYNAQWDVLTGYPSGYGADDQINDHHFHASYAVMAAAIVAQYDSVWAAQENWGAMVNLLIKDANNWERNDTRFPFLRSHSAYAGHSWAAGHGDFGDGNNQESSSESMHFASAVTLWGAATKQKEIRDLGIFLHATERTAVEQYWFDVNNAVFPANYQHVAIGMVWGGKGVHSTWFGADPEFIHGINILPITGGSLYLGRHPEYVKANYAEIVSERSGQPNKWKDVLWEFLALGDAAQAMTYFLADPNYEQFDGESKAHTYHWLGNLKRMGHVDTSVTATIPTYAVFKDAAGDKTYAAYNPESGARLVTFSDGFAFTVPARSMSSRRTGMQNSEAPVTLLIADKTMGKAPLRVQFQGSKSFDPRNEALTHSWSFGNGVTSSKADTVITYTVPGSYNVKLQVQNASGFFSSDSLVIEVRGNGTPYGGTARLVPGIIEAEQYDVGGEGIAYHDVDANNIGLAFRPNEGVDIESIAGGFGVYWIVAGEWLEYTINVPADGLYDIIPKISTVPGFGNFRLYVNNEDVSGRRNVPGTGAWQNYASFTIANVPLKAGVQVMRIEADSDSDKKGWLFSLNSIEVKKSTSVSNEDEPGLPKTLMLHQNYPNPFNPSTQISFALPYAGKVSLTVFNMLGQNVQTLVNHTVGAGNHTVTFDASNLANGVYLYRLEAGGQVLTRKMLLMK